MWYDMLLGCAASEAIEWSTSPVARRPLYLCTLYIHSLICSIYGATQVRSYVTYSHSQSRKKEWRVTQVTGSDSTYVHTTYLLRCSSRSDWAGRVICMMYASRRAMRRMRRCVADRIEKPISDTKNIILDRNRYFSPQHPAKSCCVAENLAYYANIGQ